MALNYCHTEQVVHRDLKPENFLFQDKSEMADLKIIDFGLSKIMGAGRLQRMKTRAGTPYYISPEVLAGNYDVSCDMWSAGCMLYILLCGYPPFYGDDNQEILQMVQKGEFDFDGEEWDDVSKDAKDLIKALITKPERRLTAGEALGHKWIKKYTKKDLSQSVLKSLKVDNMKKFQKSEKIKQVALMAIAVQTDPNEIQDLKKIFMELDADGSGSITLDELQRGLGERENAEALLQVLQAADTDGNGVINYTEFIAATLSAQTFMKEEYLKTAFNMFDKDGSGKIDSSELNGLLSGEEFKDVYTEDQLR
jgi:calcium-dependent protein kinase